MNKSEDAQHILTALQNAVNNASAPAQAGGRKRRSKKSKKSMKGGRMCFPEELYNAYYGKEGTKKYFECMKKKYEEKARKNQGEDLIKDKSGNIVGGLGNVTEYYRY